MLAGGGTAEAASGRVEGHSGQFSRQPWPGPLHPGAAAVRGDFWGPLTARGPRLGRNPPPPPRPEQRQLRLLGDSSGPRGKGGDVGKVAFNWELP